MALVGLAAGAVGVLTGVLLSGGDAGGPGGQRTDEGRDPVAELVALRAAVELERSERAHLADEVALLRSVVDTLIALEGTGGDRGANEPADASAANEDLARAADEDGVAGPAAAADLAATPGLVFDSDRLLAVGVSPNEVERLRGVWEQSQLERLYLSNEAAREGWTNTAQHRENLRTVREELRDSLGEDGFDQMLYATGRANRVVVRDVLSGSQASRVGLLPGDQIVRYADERVYGPRLLNRLTAEGEAGSPVRVEVLREGRAVPMWLERGPIGVMLDHEKREPASNS